METITIADVRDNLGHIYMNPGVEKIFVQKEKISIETADPHYLFTPESEREVKIDIYNKLKESVGIFLQLNNQIEMDETFRGESSKEDRRKRAKVRREIFKYSRMISGEDG